MHVRIPSGIRMPDDFASSSIDVTTSSDVKAIWLVGLVSKACATRSRAGFALAGVSLSAGWRC
eukprot:734559-Prymnesium_polylepis.2